MKNFSTTRYTQKQQTRGVRFARKDQKSRQFKLSQWKSFHKFRKTKKQKIKQTKHFKKRLFLKKKPLLPRKRWLPPRLYKKKKIARNFRYLYFIKKIQKVSSNKFKRLRILESFSVAKRALVLANLRTKIILKKKKRTPKTKIKAIHKRKKKHSLKYSLVRHNETYKTVIKGMSYRKLKQNLIPKRIRKKHPLGFKFIKRKYKKKYSNSFSRITLGTFLIKKFKKKKREVKRKKKIIKLKDISAQIYSKEYYKLLNKLNSRKKHKIFPSPKHILQKDITYSTQNFGVLHATKIDLIKVKWITALCMQVPLACQAHCTNMLLDLQIFQKCKFPDLANTLLSPYEITDIFSGIYEKLTEIYQIVNAIVTNINNPLKSFLKERKTSLNKIFNQKSIISWHFKQQKLQKKNLLRKQLFCKKHKKLNPILRFSYNFSNFTSKVKTFYTKKIFEKQKRRRKKYFSKLTYRQRQKRRRRLLFNKKRRDNSYKFNKKRKLFLRKLQGLLTRDSLKAVFRQSPRQLIRNEIYRTISNALFGIKQANLKYETLHMLIKSPVIDLAYQKNFLRQRKFRKVLSEFSSEELSLFEKAMSSLLNIDKIEFIWKHKLNFFKKKSLKRHLLFEKVNAYLKALNLRKKPKVVSNKSKRKNYIYIKKLRKNRVKSFRLVKKSLFLTRKRIRSSKKKRKFSFFKKYCLKRKKVLSRKFLVEKLPPKRKGSFYVGYWLLNKYRLTGFKLKFFPYKNKFFYKKQFFRLFSKRKVNKSKRELIQQLRIF